MNDFPLTSLHQEFSIDVGTANAVSSNAIMSWRLYLVPLVLISWKSFSCMAIPIPIPHCTLIYIFLFMAHYSIWTWLWLGSYRSCGTSWRHYQMEMGVAPVHHSRSQIWCVADISRWRSIIWWNWIHQSHTWLIHRWALTSFVWVKNLLLW